MDGTKHVDGVAGNAERLAAWTRLPWEGLRYSYNRERRGTAARSCPQLEADVALKAETQPSEIPLERQLILEACREAERFGFLHELSIAIVEMERLNKRPEAEVEEIAKLWQAAGVMQLMINRDAGLLDASVIYGLEAACEASACVMLDGAVIGTAFLVGADLVLTSAHVVCGEETPPGAAKSCFARKLKEDLVFLFPKSKRVPREIQIAPHPNGLIDCSLPHGDPPNTLLRTLGAAAAGKLDYALVRLARQVSDIPPLDITNAEWAERDRKCFVIGYPLGSNAPKFDGDTVHDIDTPAGRIFYRTNTVAGMSGGCCIGARGKPVALHEGGFPTINGSGASLRDGNGQPLAAVNRAVSLAAIRDLQRKSQADPLLSKPRSPGLVMNEPGLIDDWYKVGLRLAGPDHQKDWEARVGAALGAVPGAGADLGTEHPWFERKELEAWIDRAKAGPNHRIAYVTGEPGTGKSFAARIVGAKLDQPERDLVRVTSTLTTMLSWSEALAKLGQARDGDTLLRTDPAAVRYADAGTIIATLRRHGGLERTAEGPPLFVAFDFGPDGAEAADVKPWLELIGQLAAEPWVRILVIALGEQGLTQLDARLQAAPDPLPATEEFDMPAAGEEELIRFIQGIYKERGLTAPRPGVLRERWLKDWKAGPGLRNAVPALQTAEAVLAALTIYHQVLTDVDSGSAGGQNGG